MDWFPVWLSRAGRKENMSLSDPIGDMIARIKNAQMRNHKKVELPSSNFKVKIVDILILPILDIKIPYK